MGEIVWLGRYPVKSMRGEALTEAAVGAAGVEGDRRYALRSSSRAASASATRCGSAEIMPQPPRTRPSPGSAGR
jgi:uncharacterized protein YcbX